MKSRNQTCHSLKSFYSPCRVGRCCMEKERRAKVYLSTLLPPSQKKWGCTGATLIHFRLQHHFLPQQKDARPHCIPWTILWALLSYLRLCCCPNLCHRIYILFFHLIQTSSGISTWLSHREQGFPNCDTSTIPCIWDTPKLLLNTIQIVDPLLPHILFTKPKWHTTKCGWVKALLLGIRGLELFPTPTAYSRRVLFQFLFSKSFFLSQLPRLTHLRKKGS